MSNEIQDVEGPPGDDAIRRNRPANPDDPTFAVEPKHPTSIGNPVPAQAERTTQAGASSRKRRKRFVL
jgi:hypothetical protein